MEDILDLERYPLHQLDGRAGRELVDWCKAELKRVGLFNLGLLQDRSAVLGHTNGLEKASCGDSDIQPISSQNS